MTSAPSHWIRSIIPIASASPGCIHRAQAYAYLGSTHCFQRKTARRMVSTPALMPMRIASRFCEATCLVLELAQVGVGVEVGSEVNAKIDIGRAFVYSVATAHPDCAE